MEEILQYRCTKGEKRQIEKRAGQEGVSASHLLRKATLLGIEEHERFDLVKEKFKKWGDKPGQSHVKQITASQNAYLALEPCLKRLRAGRRSGLTPIFVRCNGPGRQAQ